MRIACLLLLWVTVQGCWAAHRSPGSSAIDLEWSIESAAITTCVSAQGTLMCWGTSATRPTPVSWGRVEDGTSIAMDPDAIDFDPALDVCRRGADGRVVFGTRPALLPAGLLVTDGLSCCSADGRRLVCVSRMVGASDPAVDLPGPSPIEAMLPTGLTGHLVVVSGDGVADVDLGTGSVVSLVARTSLDAVLAAPGSGCAIDDSGELSCWGDASSLLPLEGELPRGLLEIDGMPSHVCARDGRGQVFCWGRSGVGYRPDGPRVPVVWRSPVRLSLRAPAVSIAVGFWHSCALLEDDSVWCWGSNVYGQLGDGTQVDSAVPVRVVGLPGPP
jgi:hypothetical protein